MAPDGNVILFCFTYRGYRAPIFPLKGISGIYGGLQKAFKRPLKGFYKGPKGLLKALKSLVGPLKGLYKALKGLIRPLRAL